MTAVDMDPQAVRRIEDWHQPWLPAPFRLLNRLPDPLARRLAPLTEASLLRAARRSTGLDDFGSEDYLEPLRMILADLADDDRLTPLGRITARTILGQLLRARLRIQDHMRRHPDALSRTVRSPIVVVGLPRTGTTHLHNLLSRVPALRFLPLWESIEPLPATGPQSRLPDLRRFRGALRVRQIDYMIPLFRLMHEVEVDLPHEELQLSAATFRSFFFEGSWRLPRYQPWYAEADHADAYAYLRRVLQLLQRPDGQERGGHKSKPWVLESKRWGLESKRWGLESKRWVLKSPQHLDQLGALCKAFPDARIVRTHRDPVRVVLSLATMLNYTSRVCYRDLDLVAESRFWTDRVEQMLRTSLDQAERLPGDQLLDIRFHEFMKNPEATIEKVADFAQVPLDEAARCRIRAHLEASARDRHGRIDYRFEDMGLDPHELREQFRFYQERFDLPDEP